MAEGHVPCLLYVVLIITISCGAEASREALCKKGPLNPSGDKNVILEAVSHDYTAIDTFR